MQRKAFQLVSRKIKQDNAIRTEWHFIRAVTLKTCETSSSSSCCSWHAESPFSSNCEVVSRPCDATAPLPPSKNSVFCLLSECNETEVILKNKIRERRHLHTPASLLAQVDWVLSEGCRSKCGLGFNWAAVLICQATVCIKLTYTGTTHSLL